MPATNQSVFNMLKGVFVDGFNTRTASGGSVSGGVATLNFATAHGFEQDVVVTVSGATPSGVNGSRRLVTASGSTLTFGVSGVSDGAISGTISVSVAPLGWAMLGTPTTLPATFYSTDPTGTGMAVTFNATTQYLFSYSGFRGVSGGSTFGGFGSTGLRLMNNFGATVSVAWLIVGDGRTFYLLLNGSSGSSTILVSGRIHTAGDFQKIAAVDGFATLVQGSAGTSADGTAVTDTVDYSGIAAVTNSLKISGTVGGGVVAATYACMESIRPADGVSGAVANVLAPAYPNPANTGLILSRKVVADQNTMRGYMRGLYMTPQPAASAFGMLDRITGQGALSGKRLLAVRCGSESTTTTGPGVVFFDITGPWES